MRACGQKQSKGFSVSSVWEEGSILQHLYHNTSGLLCCFFFNIYTTLKHFHCQVFLRVQQERKSTFKGWAARVWFCGVCFGCFFQYKLLERWNLSKVYQSPVLGFFFDKIQENLKTFFFLSFGWKTLFSCLPFQFAWFLSQSFLFITQSLRAKYYPDYHSDRPFSFWLF